MACDVVEISKGEFIADLCLGSRRSSSVLHEISSPDFLKGLKARPAKRVRAEDMPALVSDIERSVALPKTLVGERQS